MILHSCKHSPIPDFFLQTSNTQRRNIWKTKTFKSLNMKYCLCSVFNWKLKRVFKSYSVFIHALHNIAASLECGKSSRVLFIVECAVVFIQVVFVSPGVCYVRAAQLSPHFLPCQICASAQKTYSCPQSQTERVRKSWRPQPSFNCWCQDWNTGEQEIIKLMKHFNYST